MRNCAQLHLVFGVLDVLDGPSEQSSDHQPTILKEAGSSLVNGHAQIRKAESEERLKRRNVYNPCMYTHVYSEMSC